MLISFGGAVIEARRDLLRSDPVDAGSWHSIPTDGNPLLVTMEIAFYRGRFWIPTGVDELQEQCRPNLPWAEDHFQERVSGQPLNPAPSHKDWPWAHAQHHDSDEKFSHTYPERFWPKNAGNCVGWGAKKQHNGIRYEYGDLHDVVTLLKKNLYTRQAVLPVFFPEDTGNVVGVRIPCSLFYNFIFRNGELHCHYSMRSCDFVRHFKDDVYMAARLLQWVAYFMNVPPGFLHLSITSLHAMEGDRYRMTEDDKNGKW